MPDPKKDVKALTTRQQKASTLVDTPPLGHLQALVLCELAVLGKEAYGYKVLEAISHAAGVWLNAPDVYGSIRRLLDKELIEHVETRPQASGPPVKVYKLTAAGHTNLKETAAHHRALAAHFASRGKG